MKIRLPADLKDQIEAASKQSGRSMNAEIVARLEGTFGAGATANSNLHALALRLAQLELQLADSQMEAEMLTLDSNIASGLALSAVNFNSENGHPQPLSEQELAELRTMYKISCDRIDKVDEKKYKELAEQASTAIDRIAKLQASALPATPRRFGITRFASKKPSDH